MNQKLTSYGVGDSPESYANSLFSVTNPFCPFNFCPAIKRPSLLLPKLGFDDRQLEFLTASQKRLLRKLLAKPVKRVGVRSVSLG
jgi:hypothetical protein